MLGGSNAGHNRQRQNEMDKVVKELEGDVEKMDLRNFEYPFSRNIFIKSFEVNAPYGSSGGPPDTPPALRSSHCIEAT